MKKRSKQFLIKDKIEFICLKLMRKESSVEVQLFELKEGFSFLWIYHAVKIHWQNFQ